MSTENQAIIICSKTKQPGNKLTFAPYPGELGQRIMEQITQETWQAWLDEQTKLINEHRLNPLEQSTRQRLEQAMVNYLFPTDKDKST